MRLQGLYEPLLFAQQFQDLVPVGVRDHAVDV
jgi:hypothetical protein